MGCDNTKSTSTAGEEKPKPSQKETSSQSAQKNAESKPQQEACSEPQFDPKTSIVQMYGEAALKDEYTMDDVKERIIPLIEITRKEEGCICFFFGRDMKDENKFGFFARFKNPEAAEFHFKNPDLQDLIAPSFELFPSFAPTKSIILPLDSVPPKNYAFSEFNEADPEVLVFGWMLGKQDNIKNEFLTKHGVGLVKMVREEEGNLAFDIGPIPESEKFFMSAIFKNADALNTHFERPEIKEMGPKVEEMVKEQFHGALLRILV